jgi:hypothetical protein
MAITAAAQPNAAPMPKAVRNVMVLIMQPSLRTKVVNDLQGGSFLALPVERWCAGLRPGHFRGTNRGYTFQPFDFTGAPRSVKTRSIPSP